MLAFVAGLPQLGVAIFVVIVFNGVFAFAQQYRAEHAAERLRDLLPRRATVLRDGRRFEIDAAELVVDDLVALDPGDRVSADLRVVESHDCRVDTSMLTGESIPSTVEPGSLVSAGTFVVEGEATAVVEAIGSATRIAGLAELTRTTVRPSGPLANELTRVVRTMAAIAVGVGVSFFVLSLLVGMPTSDGFVFAIGVTVALVPEGLLPTVTLSLAIGAQRMAGRQALVRRLEAVETLGSTTFICTDKTGTLTENRMAVVEAWTPSGGARIDGSGYDPTATIDARPLVRDALEVAARTALRCSNGRVVERDGEWVAQGDPMEAAVHALALRSGVDEAEAEAQHPVVRRFPFDPRRRRMAVVTPGEVLVKGAPDAVIPCCTNSGNAEAAVAALAAKGLRVLAIARRDLDGPVPPDATTAERGLTLLALLGLEDPPRRHAAAAIAACRRAGMKVAMVTGDHPATAAAIAEQVGLSTASTLVVEGDDLPADDARFGALIDRDGIVLARITPEQKLRIAATLRARGHVVAMTGDGVNDGPALQEADIGIAMGHSGTDVAREAADLVLLDDDFATIVVAIEQGRATYANVRRFLTYHLTDNVAELTPFVVWALSGGRFPLAIGVLQVLALDIGTDTLPAVALGAEPPSAHVLERPPSRGRLLDRSVLRRAFGVLGPAEAAASMLAFLATMFAGGWRPGETFPEGSLLAQASGAAFTAIVLGQMANAFACRSQVRSPFAMNWRTNRFLLVAVAVELLTLAVFLWVPLFADLLDHAPPGVVGWLFALVAPVAVLTVDALDKRGALRRRTE
ncbi:MAG: cation-transporting P-type ATPase [Actinomycetota bacterium]|nr:cation-transporting P-type ATPase [Actinomycetota bacterium]